MLQAGRTPTALPRKNASRAFASGGGEGLWSPPWKSTKRFSDISQLVLGLTSVSCAEIAANSPRLCSGRYGTDCKSGRSSLVPTR